MAYVFHHYRLNVSVALLRRVAGTNKNGSTALGLVETARSFNFTAKGIRCHVSALDKVALPAIAHMQLRSGANHYIVLNSVSKKGFRVMDPATGRMAQYAHDQFTKEWTGVLVILAPGLHFKAGDKSKTAFARICELLLPQKAVLIQAFVGAIVATILSLSTTIYVQKIVDNVIVDGNANLLTLLGLSMLGILAFRLLLGWFQTRLMFRSAQRIDAALFLGYYRHLLKLPQSFFDTMRVGEITARLSDAVRIRAFLNGTFLNLLLQPLILIFALGAMFFYSWKLAFLSIAAILLNIPIYLASNWLNRKYQRMLMARGADFDAQLVESLNSQPLIKAFGIEDYTSLKTEARFVRLLRPNWEVANSSLLISSSAAFLTQAYSIGLLWLGATQVLQANLTAGQLMSCYALAGFMTGPVNGIIGMNTAIQEALIATERLYEIIDLECEQDQGSLEITTEMISDIVFEDVSFKYPGRGPVVTDLNLVIRAGHVTAFIGPSGCGKSTLFALIRRIYSPSKGRIMIGGTDIQEATLESLRRMIAVVPQHIQLFSGTISENLAPGTIRPDMARMRSVCGEVGILGFIEALPLGFGTKLTENGGNFSGGQRQRMGIARALYTGAPILLFDEPSAALDAQSQEALIQLIVRLKSQGRTIVLTAHTKEIVEIADQICDIAAGVKPRIILRAASLC